MTGTNRTRRRLLGILAWALLAGAALGSPPDGVTFEPPDGAAIPPEQALPEVSVHAPPGAVGAIRVTDEAGAPVPGRVEDRGEGALAFVPDGGPFPPGQYTVHAVGAGVVATFTVGPDEYPPVVVAAEPGPVARDGTVTIDLSEPLDVATLAPGSVLVTEETDDGPRVVSGTVAVGEDGTSISFTPDAWPGFTPGGTFTVAIGGTVTDRAGNPVSGGDVELTGGEEVRIGNPRVPEGVYWSSRREVGVLDLALRPHGPFDTGQYFLVGDPAELVVDPKVDARGNGSVYGIDPHDRRVVVMQSETGLFWEQSVWKPCGIAGDRQGTRLYVSTWDRGRGVIRAYDTTGYLDHPLWQLDPISTGRDVRPGDLAVSPDGSELACLLPDRARAAIYDVSSGREIRSAFTDSRPTDLAYVPREGGGSVLLVTCRGARRRGGTVIVWDEAEGRVIGRLEGFSKPARIAVRGSRAWVAEEAGRRVTAIDVPAEGMPVVGPSFRAGRRPCDVALAPDGSDRLFVVNRRASRITVLSSETGEVLSTARAKGAIAVAAWEGRE